MGLDQYAYAKTSVGAVQEELTYWRKHNRLHGWMEELWEDKGRPNAEETEPNPMGDFNCVELEVTESDLEQLEAHIEEKSLPDTGGFFFGNDSFEWTNDNDEPFEEGDYYYKQEDLKFITLARQAIAKGKKVYYNSWW